MAAISQDLMKLKKSSLVEAHSFEIWASLYAKEG
jgi:hypothetical protein